MSSKEVSATKTIAYKAFDENLQCRGFQYEVGKTYIHEGKVKACESGFHSCQNPFDVLNYYDITSRFALVEVSGKTDTHENDSKIASAEITIKAELQLPDFVMSCVYWLQAYCKAASGSGSKLAASGSGSKLAASGYGSQLAASGSGSVIVCSGTRSKAKAGKNGAIALTRWVESEGRYRISVGYVGEDLKEDTFYTLCENGNFVECE